MLLRRVRLVARCHWSSRGAACQDILHFPARVLVIQTREASTRGIESRVHTVYRRVQRHFHRLVRTRTHQPRNLCAREGRHHCRAVTIRVARGQPRQLVFIHIDVRRNSVLLRYVVLYGDCKCTAAQSNGVAVLVGGNNRRSKIERLRVFTVTCSVIELIGTLERLGRMYSWEMAFSSLNIGSS